MTHIFCFVAENLQVILVCDTTEEVDKAIEKCRNLYFLPMNLNNLPLSKLEALQEQLLNRLCRVRVAIQRQKGMAGIEQQIALLPKKQQAFISTLWKARGQLVLLMDIEMAVWGREGVNPETVRRLVYDSERRLETEGIPIIVDCRKRKNGDLIGYKIKKK
jgi:hypothetical protein